MSNPFSPEPAEAEERTLADVAAELNSREGIPEYDSVADLAEAFHVFAKGANILLTQGQQAYVQLLAQEKRILALEERCNLLLKALQDQ